MPPTECAPLHTFHLLGKKDFVPILEEFYFGKYEGFNHLTRKIKITPKQLSQRLKEMEEGVLIEKKEETYYLTSKGKELSELIQHIKEFHTRYHQAPVTCAGNSCGECVLFVK
ncbi:MAG: winged helix-turn-helix transcriptional regulator [archaeon]